MVDLAIAQLTEAVAGGAVALRSIMRLQPADGPGGKVFPPTYAVSAENKYAVEERQVGDQVVTTVLLDSVASQANRAELALLDGWEAGELSFPVPYVDFTGESDLDDLGRITVLEAPHRFADAIFRDSLLGGTLFRLSDVGQRITEARPGNATDMFRYAPTALLFGQWDSTGPKGGLGSKFQRAYVSEIVGLDAKIGRKVGSRIVCFRPWLRHGRALNGLMMLSEPRSSGWRHCHRHVSRRRRRLGAESSATSCPSTTPV